MKNKIITTQDSAKKTVKVKPKRSKTKMITTGDLGKKLTPRDFVIENIDCLSNKEIERLKTKIEKELEARHPEYWKCNNPACGFVTKRPWGSEKISCLWCNFNNYEEGGWLEKMSAKEAAEYEEKEKERMRIIAEKMLKQKFERSNKSRREVGEPELTFDEFKELQKKHDL